MGSMTGMAATYALPQSHREMLEMSLPEIDPEVDEIMVSSPDTAFSPSLSYC
jgi:hypothetical protein